MNNEVSNESDSQVFSRKVLELITVANEFCLSLEKKPAIQPARITLFSSKIAPLLYLKASLLPDIEPSDEDATEHFVTEEEWENLFNGLFLKFGEEDSFFYIDLREKSHQDPVKGSLAECFTDVYQDLRDFLLLFQKPLRANKENAVKECKMLFESRFGYKLLIAQTAIHSILYKTKDVEYDF